MIIRKWLGAFIKIKRAFGWAFSNISKKALIESKIGSDIDGPDARCIIYTNNNKIKHQTEMSSTEWKETPTMQKTNNTHQLSLHIRAYLFPT